MEIFKVSSDAGFTGANLNRPALSEMLADIKQGKINLVISYKIDRLTRSPKDFYQLIELFEKHGVDFISVTERFETSTPSGRLLRNIMLTFAQFERELASERTKDKMIQRAQKGIEKSLWAKKFIKNIEYSKSDIQINVYYSMNLESLSFSEFVSWHKMIEGKTAEQFSPHTSSISVCNMKTMAPLSKSLRTVPIILPNSIHQAKERNLKK